MLPKVIFAIGFVVISLGLVLGAPRAIHTDKDLRRNIEEFLKQDQPFLAELEKGTLLGNGLRESLRTRRQTEIDEVDNQTDDVAQQSEGFFDRAAKFVVDLLQRFLKWINTDSN